MLTKLDPKISFIDKFDETIKLLSANNTPEWLNTFRQNGLSKFQELGFPTTKNEDWKYTNLSPVVTRTYKILSTEKKLLELNHFKEYCNPDEINIVFINGIFSKEFATLNDLDFGIKVSTIKDALIKNELVIKQLLTKYSTNTENVFITLNNALLNDGILIEVGNKVISQKLIHIIHVASSINEESLFSPRTIITLGASSEATILESHISFNDESVYFSNSLTDIFLAENATLHYCKAQKESLKSYSVSATRVLQERNSHFDHFSITAGSAITRNNLDVILEGEGSHTSLQSLYSIYLNQHVDNHTSIDHQVPNCTSNQLYKGILNGSSRAVFNGKIFVRPIAQQTNSYQLNKNLLLGKDCRVDTKPQLEIFADDVKCTHGATIGQLNEEEIFYLQSRSIARKDAIKMLARGFAEDLLQNIKNESVHQKLNRLLEPSFAQL